MARTFNLYPSAAYLVQAVMGPIFFVGILLIVVSRTVFEISAAPEPMLFVWLAIVAAGLGGISFGWITHGRNLTSMRSVFPYLWGSIAILIGGAAASVTLFHQVVAFQAYRRGDTDQIAGTVHVLTAEPAGGSPRGDQIEIAGRRLSVGRAWKPGYDRTIARGGALREGAVVRLWLHRDEILRIDLAAPELEGSASEQSLRIAWAIFESCRGREIERDRREPSADGPAEDRAIECAARRLRVAGPRVLELHERAAALDPLASSLCRTPCEEPLYQHPVVLAPEPVEPLRNLLPPEACETPIEGVVILRIVVTKTGEVSDVEVVRALGVEPTRAAIAAVRDSAWNPALVCGRPVAVHYVVSIPFSPEETCDSGSRRPAATVGRAQDLQSEAAGFRHGRREEDRHGG